MSAGPHVGLSFVCFLKCVFDVAIFEPKSVIGDMILVLIEVEWPLPLATPLFLKSMVSSQ